MKRSIIAGMLMFLMAGTASVATAGEVKNEKITVNADKSTDKLINRLHEIKAMDIKHMNRAEKKELRKEVLGIKKEMKSKEPVVYISLGAGLLIILLLLLLL